MMHRANSLPCLADAGPPSEDAADVAPERKDRARRRTSYRTGRQLASSLQLGSIRRRSSRLDESVDDDDAWQTLEALLPDDKAIDPSDDATVDSVDDSGHVAQAAEDGTIGRASIGVAPEETAEEKDTTEVAAVTSNGRKRIATRTALVVLLLVGIVLGITIAILSRSDDHTSEPLASISPSQYEYAENEVAEFHLPASWQPGGYGPKLDIDGFSPSGPGPFPVYVWLTGTGESHWKGDDKTHVLDMARRGFVAVSVDYPNDNYPRQCRDFVYKARDIFIAEEEWSAISAICKQDKADCARGIAVSGFSQGANLASMAHNFHTGVKAAYLIGNVEPNVKDCWDKVDTTLDRSKMLSVMGEDDRNADPFGDYERVAVSLESTTGYLRGEGLDCDAGARDCIQSDGSGWKIVRPDETASGRAGHCFAFEEDACWKSTFDANYYPSESSRWGMKKAHEWLARTTLLPQEEV